MMSYLKYQELNEISQIQMLWVDGVYVDLVRHSKKLRINLYVLYDFYVEVFFDKENEEPIYIKAFIDLKKLDPYLKQINIDHLLKSRKDDFWF